MSSPFGVVHFGVQPVVGSVMGTLGVERSGMASETCQGDTMRAKTPKNIDEYIAAFPRDVQETLQKIRITIRKAAPGVEETISYQIPTFTLKGGYLIYFAAYKKHISLYPAPRGSEEFKEELSAYEGGKGTVRFPLDKPVPFALIRRIVKFRVKETLRRVEAKGKKRAARA